MWSNFFRDGGFGMYPTALFGFLLVASTVVLALRPERRFLRISAALAVATVASAVLGTSVGVIKTMRYATDQPAGEQVGLIATGCAESLNVVVLGLILTTLASLLALVAALRAGRAPVAASVG